jgi:hypothetical protein
MSDLDLVSDRFLGSTLRLAFAKALVLVSVSSASAAEFQHTDGWSSSLSGNVSLGTSVRNQSPDSELFSAPDGNRVGETGGTGGSNTDSGNLNYDKGDAFSTLLKANVDWSLTNGTAGSFVRIKAWYDFALKDNAVRMGNGANGYVMGQPLSDSGFDPLQKFSGVQIMDAYVYNSFDLAGAPAQFRLGRQVINWGESLFIQGLNQIAPIDLSALRKPGVELKDAFIPVDAVSMNVGLGNGKSLEGFYQYNWRPANIDSCGTYWSPVEFQLSTSSGGPCSTALTTLSVSNADAVTNPESPGYLAYVPIGPGRDGDHSNQFGLGLRLPVDAVDGEIGLYGMVFSSRVPYVSGRSGSDLRAISQGPLGEALNPRGFINPIQNQVAGAAALGVSLIPGTGFWEYPSDIQMYGISLSTNLAGWSVGAEVSHSPNYPAQINAADLLYGLVFAQGPMGQAAVDAAATPRTEVSGYKRLKRTQLQVNGIRVLPRMLSSSQSVLVGEVAVQHTNVGSKASDLRFGRAFIFGIASHDDYSAGFVNAVNPQLDGRKADGFVTDYSWGYRLRLQLEYPGFAGTSATLYPTVSLSHDVSGYSLDGQFIEGRQTVGLGTRLNINKVHNLEFNYVYYADSAKYDPFRDRDYYSLVLSTSF